MGLTYTGLFSGAGGLDLGFDNAGFLHGFSSDIDPWSVRTLRSNRPKWTVEEADICEMSATELPETDVLLAGFPCQGFSLGGHRRESDERNYLYKEVVRITKSRKPRYVVVENVLNLRTMTEPNSGKPFVEVIAGEFERLGYHVRWEIFRVSEHGVPQTRRRFIFIASRDPFPASFLWLLPEPITTADKYLGDLAANPDLSLANHNIEWGFSSRVHTATGKRIKKSDHPVPCRFSRTGSDGHPIRSLDAPFPAIDTATIWGWAQGNVKAERKQVDRSTSLNVRNPDSKIKLWRIRASRLRSFTDREYARLQTFPDEWEFFGTTKRHIHKQIGNAVPVEFATRIGELVRSLHRAQISGKTMQPIGGGAGDAVQTELSFS